MWCLLITIIDKNDNYDNRTVTVTISFRIHFHKFQITISYLAGLQQLRLNKTTETEKNKISKQLQAKMVIGLST